jgi:hypothetical protein
MELPTKKKSKALCLSDKIVEGFSQLYSQRIWCLSLNGIRRESVTFGVHGRCGKVVEVLPTEWHIFRYNTIVFLSATKSRVQSQNYVVFVQKQLNFLAI